MKNLDIFGKVIASELKDAALNRYLSLESGSLMSQDSQKLSSELASISEEHRKIIRKLLTSCIDNGIHSFLFSLEERKEEISIVVNSENIAEKSDGLQGEIYTQDGWFERFSQHGESGI